MTDTFATTPKLSFLRHSGEMARRIREADWTSHPLGQPESWPTALRVMLDVALSSSFPTAIYWGPELSLLYNDAWIPVPAERHPWALGQPAEQVWEDIWATVGPQFADVMAGAGVSTYDQLLPMRRDGEVRETYWTYSLSPIRDDDGAVCGVFNQGNETTRIVMAERKRVAEIARFQELFQQAPGAIALVSGRDFIVDFANATTIALIGREDAIGKKLADIWPEVADAGFLELLRQVLATGEPYRATGAPVPFPAGDGNQPVIRLLDFVYQPIRDGAGAVTDILIMATDVTERATAEDALREKEGQLQRALDSPLGIGTWDWDVASDRVTSDARFAELYGVDPKAAARGASIATFFAGIHPDDLPRVRAAIDATLSTGVPFAEEYRLVQPDGSNRWTVAQGSVQFDIEGKPVRFPGISFDITKRREAEDAARAAAADLRIATEAQGFVYRLAERLRRLSSADAIQRLTVTALGRRLGADRVGFYRLLPGGVMKFGACWTSERSHPPLGPMTTDDIGEAMRARYHAGEVVVVDDYPAGMATVGEMLTTLAGAGIGMPLHRNGRWAATLYVNQVVPRHWTGDEVALVEAVAEIAWDAVERSNAIAALRDSEEKFRAIANSIDQMVWSTRSDGFHDYYNERWYEFTGLPKGVIGGTAWSGLFHPDDKRRAWELWFHSLSTGEPYRCEYRLRHHSGEYRWVLGSAQAVRDSNDRITRWFGSCTDIEEIVRAREVLAQSRIQLEAAVAERTEQLMATEEQLRQAQKMEAVGQLTGGIAHDFNNMLAVVIGALDLLERRIAQGRTDVARYVDAARDGATRAAALTQRLLSFARQSPLAPVAIDVGALIDGMIELLTRTIGESIVVKTRCDDGLWPATADSSQLENAILNLAVNARDAMPRGGRLEIAADNLVIGDDRAASYGIAPGDYVCLSVADTGTGMSADIAAKAFDPFFTTKTVGKGTGLGLSQVFGFVRQSGGHITLETVLDSGTTVRLFLPRAIGGVAVAPQKRDTAGPLPRAREDETVMVVEDEERVRSYSAEALRELGYRVVTASDGPSALMAIDAGERIDLLFTDVVMPEMTGLELAEAAGQRIPGLRILFTSGYTRDAIEEDGSVAAAILNKPFDVATLADRVRATLDADAAPL